MKGQGHYRQRLSLAILLIVVAGAHGVAQHHAETTRVTNAQNGISDNFYLITVTVNLGYQRGALDLARENFALSDNGIRQDIAFFTRIQPNSDNNDVIYALGYHPQIWLFDGKRRKVRVVVHDATGKKLKAQFSPRKYSGIREFFNGP